MMDMLFQEWLCHVKYIGSWQKSKWDAHAQEVSVSVEIKYATAHSTNSVQTSRQFRSRRGSGVFNQKSYIVSSCIICVYLTHLVLHLSPLFVIHATSLKNTGGLHLVLQL